MIRNKAFHLISIILFTNNGAYSIGDVFPGRDGYLFYMGEVNAIAKSDINRSVDNVSSVVSIFRKHGVKTLILVVPTKLSVVSEYISQFPLGRMPNTTAIKNIDSFMEPNDQQYSFILEQMKKKDVDYFDLMPTLLDYKINGKYPVWVNKDSHWTPMGAYQVGVETAQYLEKNGLADSLPKIKLNYSEVVRTYLPDLYRSEDEWIKTHTYVKEKVVVPLVDRLDQLDLLGNDTPQVVLCGSSYSLKPFPGLSLGLMSGLSADVLNNAVDGGGLWKSVQQFTNLEIYKGQLPKIVVWEMPERFFNQPDPDGGIEALDNKLNTFLSSK